MQKTFTAFVALVVMYCLPEIVHSQTFTVDDIPLGAGQQESLWYRANFGTFAAPAVGEDVVWDFSDMTWQGTRVLREDFIVPDNDPNFPTATAILVYDVSLGALQIEGSKQYVRSDSAGYHVLGFQERSAVLDFGGGILLRVIGDDEHSQVHNGDEGIKQLEFPLTLGTSWGHNTRANTKYELTYPPGQLVDTPVDVFQRVVRNDSVIASGTVRYPGSDVEYSALLVRSRRVITDSVFLAGQPAPPQLLSVFGLVQGGQTGEYVDKIFIAGLNAWAIEVWYDDDSFTQISSAYYNAEHPTPTSVAEFTANVTASVFPNPVADDHVTIQLPANKNSQQRTLRVVNTLGELVEDSTLAGDIDTHRFLTPQANGLYFYSITDNAGVRIASGSFTVAK